MPKLDDPAVPAAGSPVRMVQQPSLYAALLDEADRRHRMVDRIIVRGLVSRRPR